MLTHFSQRYPKLLPGLDLLPGSDTLVAHDGLSLDLSCALPCDAIMKCIQHALEDEDTEACTDPLEVHLSDMD